jgi:hypothetical protein
MADVLCNSHPPAVFFPRVRGEVRVIEFVEHGLIPTEIQQWSNVVSQTIEGLNGDGIIVGSSNIIEQKTYVHKAQHPKICRRTGTVEDRIDDALEGLVTPFVCILVLLQGLSLPIQDMEVMHEGYP